LKTTLRQILVTVFILLIVFTGVQFTLQSFRVEGASMETSFFNDQYLLVDKLTYHFHSPKRGDVIVFHNPGEPSELYIKRIIGEPGDTVEIRDNKVYIKTADGELLIDPLDTPWNQNPDSWEVPPDHYFVLGDNRNHSSDSRSFGPIPEENIVGKVWLSYWPPSHWGLSPEYSTTLE
jgi:signal peptidase I